MNKEELTNFIKQQAKSLGFLDCGISRVRFLEEESQNLESWLSKGYQGKMSYLTNYFDKRLNPSLLVEGSKSIITVSYNYYPKTKQNSNSYQIAKYAYGEDYHTVIKNRLQSLIVDIHAEIGDFNYRIFVDSAPIMERVWAKESGLGWIGKNSLLISKQKGSYFFLAEIVCDLELEYDFPFKTDHCGNCSRCIDACPTEAIVQPQVIDGNKCISYLTIELKEEIEQQFKGKMQDWIFGCDICQDVCPWNRFSTPHSESSFLPTKELLNYSKKEWEELDEETFDQIFKKSAIKRTKYFGLKRNINFIK